MVNGQVRNELRDLKIKLQNIEAKANAIILSLDPFTFQQFESRFFYPRENKSSVFLYLQREIELASKEDRIGSMKMAESSLRSIKVFARKRELSFSDITVDWLKSYERDMISKGRSKTTVGMYLRVLRVVFHKAMVDSIVSRELYPFGKYKYEIPSGINLKKALQLIDLIKIRDCKLEPGSKKEWARDMWLFIYLCNGINPKDVANLRYENVGPNSITFIRAKTKHSKKNLKPVVIPLIDPIRKIIVRWGNKNYGPDDYVFNILKPGLNPLQIYNRAHDFYSKMNAEMKEIAEELGISDQVTTYVARHSYATVMKHNGASREIISESMGHSNIHTTDRYLASFELDTMTEWNNKLLDF